MLCAPTAALGLKKLTNSAPALGPEVFCAPADYWERSCPCLPPLVHAPGCGHSEYLISEIYLFKCMDVSRVTFLTSSIPLVNSLLLDGHVSDAERR